MDQLSVFVGYDNRWPLTYRACRNSILEHEPHVEVRPILQQVARAEGVYWRDTDLRASTEFSLTRFLVPFYARTRFAIFCDNDFLFTGPLSALVDATTTVDPHRAIWVVKHDEAKQRLIEPYSAKMDGQPQHLYPRKWWSALVLWDVEHPSNRRLTLAAVNDRPPSYLHRFEWLHDDEVGDVDPTWHWLDGYDTPPAYGQPAGIHLTRGTPEMGDEWARTRYADLWRHHAENRHTIGARGPVVR